MAELYITVIAIAMSIADSYMKPIAACYIASNTIADIPFIQMSMAIVAHIPLEYIAATL